LGRVCSGVGMIACVFRYKFAENRFLSQVFLSFRSFTLLFNYIIFFSILLIGSTESPPTVTVGGCNLSGRAINYVGVFCRERDFHTLARIVALITTIAQLRLKLKIQVTLLIMCALSFTPYTMQSTLLVSK